MSDKLYVLDGAILQCDQGYVPAKLLVTQNTKVKIQGKFKATDKETQVPDTFKKCKLKPTKSGHLPCIPALQPWTKTTQKATLGGSKKFLFHDSECMCATGGKITVMQHTQVNSAGSIKETFKNIAQMIPGAMLGNDRAPKVVESYWKDAEGKKRVREINYGETSQLYVRTQNVDPGESITVRVKDKNGNKIDGKITTKPFSGIVLADGTAQLEPLQTQEDWNKTV